MRPFLWRGENAIATLAACALMVLPLVEIVARTVFSTGVPGAGPFTNHLTMWVAMLGAAIAARACLMPAAGWPIHGIRFRARPAELPTRRIHRAVIRFPFSAA